MRKRTAGILMGAVVLPCIGYFAYAWRNFYLHKEIKFTSNRSEHQQQTIRDYFKKQGGFPCEPFRVNSALTYLIRPKGRDLTPFCMALEHDGRGEWMGYLRWYSTKWDFGWEQDGSLKVLFVGPNPQGW